MWHVVLAWCCRLRPHRRGVALGPHLLPPQVASTGRPRPSSRRGCPARPPGPASITRISSTDSSPASRWVMRTSERPCGHVQQVGGERVGGRGSRCSAGSSSTQDREVGQQGPGHGHPLALAARQPGPVPRRPRWPSPGAGRSEPAGQARPGRGPGAARRRWRRAARPAGSRRWSCRRGRRPGRPARPRCAGRRRPAGRWASRSA